jgi:hypothetical protein
LLYVAGAGVIPGFYEGQITNYILFTLLTVVGFFIKEKNLLSILAGSIAGPVLYFLSSNLLVWMSGGGLQRPKTLEGLIMCYNDALPFFRTSVAATLFFSAILFGSYYLLGRPVRESRTV